MSLSAWALPHFALSWLNQLRKVCAAIVHPGEVLMAIALKFDMLALFAAVAFVGAIVFGAF